MNIATLQRRLRMVAIAAAVAGVLMLSACTGKQSTNKLDSTRLEEGIGPGKLTPSQIGGEVRGFADSYVTLLFHISDQLFETELTPQTRAIISGILLQTAYGVYTIASDANPIVSLLDMVVVVTLTRMVAEEGLHNYVDEDAIEMLKICRQGEAEIWKIADQVLTEDEKQGMHVMINAWREENPNVRQVSYVRFGDFAESRRQMHTTTRGARSLFALFALDPMANLNPTTAEIERSRLLAERAFYFTKRLPMLLTATAAQVYFEIAATDEAQLLRANVATVVDVAQRLATTAEQAPDDLAERIAVERETAIIQIEGVIAAQREAAIIQIAETFRTEREALLASLESEEPRVQALLTELRQTVESTTRLVDAVAVFIPEQPADPRGEPFDVQAIVEQTTLAAEGLNALVQSVDRALAPEDLEVRLAQLDLAISRVEARGQSLINRTFFLAGLLVILIFAGSFAKIAFQRRGAKKAA